MIVISGEYPTIQFGMDGFSKRLFDYVEFERYQKDDILRLVECKIILNFVNSLF